MFAGQQLRLEISDTEEILEAWFDPALGSHRPESYSSMHDEILQSSGYSSPALVTGPLPFVVSPEIRCSTALYGFAHSCLPFY
jgi:hypothetical protein